MATIDVSYQPGTPEPKLFPKIANYTSSKATQDSLKRSFAKYLASEHSTQAVGKLFHSESHIQYEEPSYIHSMEEIGYSATSGVSPIAVSEPFRLFTEEAVNIMREEIFDKEVQEKYSYTSDIAPKQLRGYAPDHGKFIYEAWKHPETLAIISKIAGVDLVPVMDYEIGHINLSVPGKRKDHDSSALISEEDEKPIVGWHRDSYPFVCVLMMSDTTGMVGGETALRTGYGDIKKVRGPSKGCAVVLQGRYIDHQALQAFGGQERITMVTSFRPRSPHVRDDTVLTTVRPVSNLSDLYGQTVEYQLENAEARIRLMLKELRDSMKAGATSAKAIKKFLDFEIDQLTHLNSEIVDESLVTAGKLEEVCAEAANPNKKARVQ
ncbi:4b165af3-a11f-449d-9a36-0b7041e3eaf1 [Sclerotinia trifoliorum]|uniref:4b165af3-a11f-449d-9a36-0b7041e3eaf1 n=1 Tax=Sclerotinia trifoliorum TaxID=28548 RepID=A0A8H2W101_9HELO|nr:4b165af3-a11f-449d-9a36-0b7041e3eaf1 [Sclerotinia trifoliorum]